MKFSTASLRMDVAEMTQDWDQIKEFDGTIFLECLGCTPGASNIVDTWKMAPE